MALPSLGFLGFLLLVVVLFFGSTYFASRTMKREIREARDRKQPIPDIVRWWPRVAAHGTALGGLGILGILAAAGAFWNGFDAFGRAVAVVAVLALCYLAHARILVAVARRAGA